MKPFFEIPAYHDYLSPRLARHLLDTGRPNESVPDLVEVGRGGGLETPASFRFLVTLYETIKPELARVLAQRIADRKFIDERVKTCFEFNQILGRDILDPDYQTVLGLQDGAGRIVFGPRSDRYCRRGGAPVAPLPEFLKGPHVTLFGPPDSAKMAVNAMNAFHRKPRGEPPIVEELLGEFSPMWGADDEDSKTPLRVDLVDAAVNLTKCFEGTLSLTEAGRNYELAEDHLAQPIKRFPGIALPCSFLFYRGSPVPLHLYDFALHLYHNWKNPRALVFYVPKLENEEEAAYVHTMIEVAEKMVKAEHPTYTLGSVRLMVVLENPRAILRAHEIMDALDPYFAGASLGWHDYLASTARLFKADGNYRIPVKADPGIVIKYIKASHHLLADTVGSRGGIRVGGMYGILPAPGDASSSQIALKGFIKDVVTQLKRGLTGFWVAHPDFVRLGLALVEAWRRHECGDRRALIDLVSASLAPEFHIEIFDFVSGPDIEGLDRDDPNYVRRLVVADIKESDFIANNHPDEIRYNVFQSLQYLADWLSGHGCVALPTHVEGVGVRVMDDLATAERSRWEVWHELRHGRFSIDDFLRIAHEEMNFIRRDLTGADGKTTQVKWDARTEKWYPTAFKIMLKLMTDADPPEFATELLMPFTVESIRSAQDPWSAIHAIDSNHFKLERYVADFDDYFEICGSQRFARAMAQNPIRDETVGRSTILSFSVDEINEAAAFHGNIGDARMALDARAAGEQELVLQETQTIKDELKILGDAYLKKFGFKFLISAQGRTAANIRVELRRRLNSLLDAEIQEAREALWEISRKRLEAERQSQADHPGRATYERIEVLRKKHRVESASIAIAFGGQTQTLAFGSATVESQFEIASLSKTIAAAFACSYFAPRNVALSTPVNDLFSLTASTFRTASEVTLAQLMNHTALNLHYVKGFPADRIVPKAGELVFGRHGYEPITIVAKPGSEFRYSGGGFLVLEHLIEELERRPIAEILAPFLRSFLAPEQFDELTFDRRKTTCKRELDFPALAAGGFGTARAMSNFLQHLSLAFRSIDGSAGISHDTAVVMLNGFDKGARAFMGCDMGLGVFTAEAGANRLMIHQGANDGFRSLFVHCYSGPDCDKGMVLFCRADNNGVAFIAEAAREIFAALEIRGADFCRLPDTVSNDGLRQEEIVNRGYKALLFDAFVADLPEPILNPGPADPLASFNLAVNARIVAVSNEKFARAENLIADSLPIFDPELFGRQGKIMDSWESVRHNPAEFDSLTLELKAASKIRFVSFSTKYHDGNHGEFVRLEGLTSSGDWIEIVPKTALKGHSLLRVKIAAMNPPAFSRVRLSMYPDGGISRLGLYDGLPPVAEKDFLVAPVSVRFSDAIPKTSKPLTIRYETSPGEIQKNLQRAREIKRRIDWASAAYGGKIESASNEHYGPAAQVISPFAPIHMFDGLESARSRTPGHREEVIIRLGKAIEIKDLDLDFKYFVNNNPVAVSADGWNGREWRTLVEKTAVKAFAGNTKRLHVESVEQFDKVRVRVYPDGGVHRIKVFERVSPV